MSLLQNLGTKTRWPIIVARYSGVLVVVAIAAVVTRWLWQLGDSGISPLFFAAVLLCAWFGGLGPGLVATGLSGIATAYLLLPRANSVEAVTDAVLRVVVFTVVALLASSLHAASRRAAEAMRLARDAAQEANAAKSRFLAMVSHELRTPLSSIVLAADSLARDSSLDATIRQYAQIILSSTKVEVRLIDDLVDLSRMQNGKLRLNFGLVDVHEPLLAAIKMCEPDLAERRLEFITQLAATDRMVMGDAIRLQQIFWNPIRNAIKFTPDGGRIIVQTHNDGAGSVLIEVTDTGRGLEASQLTRIFSPFDQGDGLTTAHFGGLGLGLAISQGLTEAHGGTITANSPGAGCGATFQVRLPTRLAESRSALAAEKVS